MQQQTNQTASKWNKSLTWLSSHINKLWSPFQSNEHEHPVLVEKMEGKKDNSEMMKKLMKLDPKMALLQRMRSGNLNQVLEQKIKRVNKYFTKKEESYEKPCDLLCPICLQFLVKPVTTVCGHNFCIRCLDQTLLFKPQCPSCRHHLRGTKFIKCQSLHKLILRSIQKYCEQEIEVYNQCLAQSVQWLDKRTVKGDQMEVNQKIDAKDTEFIWCQATIMQIYKKQNVVQSVLIHYEGWNSIYDEIIDLNSDRLASEGFYTSRLDIPHYKNLNGEEERMYSYVVSHENEYLNHFMLINNQNNHVWNPGSLMFGQDILPNFDENPLFQLQSIEESSLQYEEPLHESSSDISQQPQQGSLSQQQHSWSAHQLQIPQNWQYDEENESNTSQISISGEEEEEKQQLKSDNRQICQKKQDNESNDNQEDLMSFENGEFNIYNVDQLHHYYTPRFGFKPNSLSELINPSSVGFEKEEQEQKQQKQEPNRQGQQQHNPHLQLSFDSIINNSSLWAYNKDNLIKTSNVQKESAINPEKQDESLI